MANLTTYRTITREQFLFNEMRIVAKLLNQKMDEKEVLDTIVKENLFQYPTERMISNIARVCLKRFQEADNTELITLVATGSSEEAKQACLFIMMEYYKLVWDFMITVIGEKYRTKNFTFTKMDLNSFFTRLQEQNDVVASWSDSTIAKSKQVLKKILVENRYLNNSKTETLNPVLLDFTLKEIIENMNQSEALIAFNCL